MKKLWKIPVFGNKYTMAQTTPPVIVRVQETRDITYVKKSAFFGLVTWYIKANTLHIANDIVIILRTPIRKIMIDNNGEIQEITLQVN